MSEPNIIDVNPHKRGLFGRLRTSFLTGLAVTLPIGVTIWLIWTVTGWIDSWVLPLIPPRWLPEQYIGTNLRGLGVIIFLIFTVLAGWMAKGLIGRSLIRWGENVVARMPVVRSVYNGLKQIAETVLSQSDTNFDRACIVEYPRRGSYGIGFVSSKAKGEIARFGGEEDPLISVFLPTTPNPTSGFLLYFRRSEVTYLDMNVEDAAKLIISAGLVYPNPKDPSLPPATAVALMRAE